MSQLFETYFKSLSGSWSLKREISTGETLIGKAVFEPISNAALLLCEEGDLTLSNGQIIQAWRNWYWHLTEPDRLEITYDKEQLEDYHLVELLKDNASFIGNAHHLCGEDCYSGAYQFSENSFVINQSVKGPNKDYSVSSHYSK